MRSISPLNKIPGDTTKKLGSHPFAAKPRAKKSGFTLVEILIVVIILGILAAIIIPQFSNATIQTRENMLKENLRIIRTQIASYRAQHWDVAPGYPNGDKSQAPTEQAFIDQMTKFTDEHGTVNNTLTPVFRYGPYLREIPENPVNNLTVVSMIDNGEDLPAAPDDSGGWIYRPDGIIFKANTSGTDQNDQSFYQY